MKDRFSEQAQAYSNFRPEYPEALFKYIFSVINTFDSAWDCGTGNGQVAYPLAQRFKKVIATDISVKQLENAKQHAQISYLQMPAEQTNFEAGSFNLVTVAQAIHWFDFDKFYSEVKRVLKPGGYIAVIGYGFLQTENEMQNLLQNFYAGTLGQYWDAERKYIDENYATIPFPFKEIEAPSFSIKYTWNAAQLLGYLGTWSACKNFEKENAKNALGLISADVYKLWANRSVEITFPILLRIGVHTH